MWQAVLTGFLSVLIGGTAKALSQRGPKWKMAMDWLAYSIAIWALLLGPAAVLYALAHDWSVNRALVLVAGISPFVSGLIVAGRAGLQSARRRSLLKDSKPALPALLERRSRDGAREA